MYSFPNLKPVCCSMSSSNCCFLTCIQVSQEGGQVAGIPISFRISQFTVIHTVKGYGIVTKAETDFFETLLLFQWSSRCLWPYNGSLPGREQKSIQIKSLFESVVTFTCFSLVTDLNKNFDMYSAHIFTTIMITPSVKTCPLTVSYDPNKNFNFFLGKMILRFPWKPEGLSLQE